MCCSTSQCVVHFRIRAIASSEGARLVFLSTAFELVRCLSEFAWSKKMARFRLQHVTDACVNPCGASLPDCAFTPVQTVAARMFLKHFAVGCMTQIAQVVRLYFREVTFTSRASRMLLTLCRMPVSCVIACVGCCYVLTA